MLEHSLKKSEENAFFLQHDLGADVHWFFYQGYAALKSNLYLPACSSFINGIEASLRITLVQIKNRSVGVDQLEAERTLSNQLLKDAHRNGLPINLLAFPSESDFDQKLDSRKPKLKHTEIVRVRHNLCHGNLIGYRSTTLDGDIFFTPECVRGLGHTLYLISKVWVAGLGDFRKMRNI